MKTISPFSSPLQLILGVDHLNRGHSGFLQRLALSNERFINIHQHSQHKDYDNIEVDTRDIRLLLWSPPDNPALKIHVFPNGVAIAELDCEVDDWQSDKTIAAMCNEQTESALKECFALFTQDIKQAASFEDNHIFKFEQLTQELEVFWTEIGRAHV